MAVYLGLVIFICGMLWATPLKGSWHWLGFAGFIIMPLTLIAMRKSGNHEGSAITPTALAFMGVAGYSNIIFIPSVKHWYDTNVWGVNQFYVPSRTVYPLGIPIDSEHMVTIHAFSAILLACLITFQWIIMLREHRSPQTILWHRRIGTFTAFIVLPTMAASGILSTIYVLLTPFNQVTYGALPLIISGCLITSIRRAIKGNYTSHLDYTYSAFIMLCSAALYRFVCLFIHLSGHSFTTSTQAPVDAAGIITYLLLIAFIVIPFSIIGRLKENIFPAITLLSVLIFSMLFVPWQFLGAPQSGSLLSHLHLF
ncbi:hypothetical protein KR52_03835 [Synechococcus sp. KORDI-52]|nr:hypothetical protein KR52_03835 [Synechococcus sp. KORDI-52]